MNPILFFIILALFAGFTIPTQAGINSQLNNWTHSPVLAATISFAVGTIGLTLYAFVMRIPLPAVATLSGQPWWIWSGGLLGAFFVASTIVLAPKLGATTMVALILAGQMIASLTLDHFGLLGYPVHPASVSRIIGVVMIVGGVALVRFF